jgi:ferredoxin-NADP reductase
MDSNEILSEKFRAIMSKGRLHTGKCGEYAGDSHAIESADFIERGWYICGPLAFVKAAKEALASLGVQPNRVSADVWG